MCPTIKKNKKFQQSDTGTSISKRIKTNCQAVVKESPNHKNIVNIGTRIIEEITYLDYAYCLNDTRLPVLRSLHSYRTIWRVSFYKEVQILDASGWYLNTSSLTERPRDCFQYTLTFSRGTFPIDYCVYHKRAVPPKHLKRTNYITKDPRYFKSRPTFEEWYNNINCIPSLLRVTYQEDCQSPDNLSYGSVSYTVTTETFEVNIYGPRRGIKKQKTVHSTAGIFVDLKIQKEVTKRAPTWIFDSAFDSTLNPYLHKGIFYF
jgi:hypothetical protein